MFAESLFRGVQKFGAACADHARSQYDNILLVCISTGKSPLECDRVDGIAHGHHNAAGLDLQCFAADRVFVFQLKMLSHLPVSDLVLLQVLLFGDAEDNEKCRSKKDPRNSGD